MPAFVIDHESQVPRDNSRELFKLIPHILVNVFITQIKYLDRKIAAEVSETRDDRHQQLHLVVARGEHETAATSI